MLPCSTVRPCEHLQTKTESSKPITWAPLTLTNLVTIDPSSTDVVEGNLKAGPSISHYSGRIVDEILDVIFAERRGFCVDTSSVCKSEEISTQESAPNVDKRLKYWREVLEKRKKLQERIQSQTGKNPDEMLFNRRSTFDNRNKETVLRILDYADRVLHETIAKKPVSSLKDVVDPKTCETLDRVEETWPKAERDGYKNVEIVGIPQVVQQELMGEVADPKDLPNAWIKSRVLEERIVKRFDDICDVVEFFPDLDKLQVTGTNVEKLNQKPYSAFIEEEKIVDISTSNPIGSEEQDLDYLDDLVSGEPETPPDLPEIGLKINGKAYIPCDKPLNECFEILTKFKCEPFQKRIKHILQVTNIGKQTISFNWVQGIYYYNRATLLLAKDSEFLFNLDSFRLTHGESYNLIVMYQPRKVGMALELWHLHTEPVIFCGNKQSLQLRFHGNCIAPKEYMDKLQELQSIVVFKSNALELSKLVNKQASLVPLLEPPLTCCAYERTLDEREVFNSLNPGYNCKRFDDLEVFKGMHKQLKKPREPQWDLRLETIKMFIIRIQNLGTRQKMFADFMVVLQPLLGAAPNLATCQMEEQKQRTRLIYVRGAICNGIEEWEDLMCTIEESFYKSELQQYFVKQMGEEEEEEEDEELDIPLKTTILAGLNNIEEEENNLSDKVTSEVLKSLHHSKFFRDALYMQTYSHLCNIAENIVSVIESTEDVPN